MLNASLASHPAGPPGLITVLLGTNDCYQRAPVATIVQRMDRLLGRIAGAAPCAATLVGTLPNFPRDQGCVDAVNASLC